MVGWRDYLRRFRPAGVAGAAAPAGVPVDRVAEARNELAPVFDLLTGAAQEARRIRETGAAEAHRRVDDARRTARTIITEAGERAPSVRAETAARVVAEANGRTPDDTAATAATRVHDRAAHRLPDLVDKAVELAIRDLRGGAP